mmetsp:Transcript_47012/g.142748  ORF Transcript_47012/g.142748 Transcript_47012/m.142748 type:complete len:213 (-) Transcript_47012:302-940(-)
MALDPPALELSDVEKGAGEVDALLDVSIVVDERFRFCENNHFTVDNKTLAGFARGRRGLLFEFDEGEWFSIGVPVHTQSLDFTEPGAQRPQTRLGVLIVQASHVNRAKSLLLHLRLILSEILGLHPLWLGDVRPLQLVGLCAILLALRSLPQHLFGTWVHDRNLAQDALDRNAAQFVGFDHALGTREIDLGIILRLSPREGPEKHLLDDIAL